MVGPDRHREVRRGGAAHQNLTEPRPFIGKPRGIGHEPGPGLVAVGWQVVQQDRAAVGSVPAIAVALLARLAAEPPPEHATGHAELGGERGPDGGMPERIGGVEHVRPPAQALRVGAAEEQVPHEALARRNELVGQDVPGADLEAAGADQGGDPDALVRADAQVVLEQHGLAVEEEAAEVWGRTRGG